jgi:hypothetical protein
MCLLLPRALSALHHYFVTFLDFDYNYFWRWTNFSDYCIFVSLFSLAGGVLTAVFINVSVYIELLGFASLLLEACLGLPQLWRNFSNQSTEGMRSAPVHIASTEKLITAFDCAGEGRD